MMISISPLVWVWGGKEEEEEEEEEEEVVEDS
jgi:hypothetical protein